MPGKKRLNERIMIEGCRWSLRHFLWYTIRIVQIEKAGATIVNGRESDGSIGAGERPRFK